MIREALWDTKVMTFIDRPLPADFEVPAIVPLKIKRPPGKPKGAIAKITRDLKEGVISAAEIVGSDGAGTGGLTGFLVDLATHHKRAFASLLVKILPMQVSGNATLGAHIGAINVISVPAGGYLSEADIERFKRPGHNDDGSSVPNSQPAYPLLELEQPPTPEPAPVQELPSLAAIEATLAALPREILLRLAGISDADDR